MPHGYCKVRNCDQFTNKDRRLVYHIPNFRTNLPLTPPQELRLKRRKAWLKALGILEDDSSRQLDDLVVCPKHFVSGKPAPIRDLDNVDWIPTLHMGLNDTNDSGCSDVVDLTLDSEEEEVDIGRTGDRAVKRKLPSDSLKDNTRGLLCDSAEGKDVNSKLPHLKPSPQLVIVCMKDSKTDNMHVLGQDANIKLKDCQEQFVSIEPEQSVSTKERDEQNTQDVITRLKIENQQLLSQNISLKAKLLETQASYKSLETDHKISMSKFSDLRYSLDKYTINEKTFVADEEKVKYFTGLPTYDVLKAMYFHIESYMETSQYPINKFQQYILTLMGIRLNIGFDLLGYVFRLPLEMVSKIFYRVLQVMYARYEPLVTWPTRENLFPSVPLLFRETFGQQIVVIADTLELSVVIDSIEVLLDGLSENGPSASTVVSNYRNRTIVKFLIGMTPQGAVTFISKGFGGNVFEEKLIETSGLMQNLLPGDIILGKRGCSVYKIVGKKSKFQKNNIMRLQSYQLNNSQCISNLKIHVERVVDIFKKNFMFWSSGLPVEFFNATNDGPSAIDKMIQACCALNNASLTVVL